MICMAMCGSGATTGMESIPQSASLIPGGQLRAATVSCAGAAGTSTRGTAAPPTATGTGPATATTTTASASLAPQHRRKIRAVPADGRFPVDGTNDSRCSGVSSEGEDSRTFYYQEKLWHR